MSESPLFRFNGIDGDTGAPFYPPLSRAAASRFARGDAEDRATAQRQRRKAGSHLGLRYGLDPKELSQAGWGIVFPKDADPAVREALEPLIRLRRGQVGDERRFRVLEGEDGIQPGETWIDFRSRHGGGPDDVDPVKLPFYLLFAGDPETVPFDFLGGLDLQHAVGRLCFDTAEEHASYARSVVEAETAVAPSVARRLTLFGARNPGDEVMELTADHLIPPVAGFLRETRRDWTVETRLAEEATRSGLAGLLGGAGKPSLLFAATHGMVFDPGSTRQRGHQGALLCQDWGGPASGPVAREHYLAAEDLDDGASPAGLIAFLFACHGAGTPRLEAYPRQDGQPPAVLAERPFVARLPQRLLGHPRGGALAVIGHVERAWCSSFVWNGEEECQAFESVFLRLLDGHPVGAALEPFATRYANLTVQLEAERNLVKRGKLDDDRLLKLWTATNDARNFVILGDPAVRLTAAARPAPPEPPSGMPG